MEQIKLKMINVKRQRSITKLIMRKITFEFIQNMVPNVGVGMNGPIKQEPFIYSRCDNLFILGSKASPA